MFKFIYEGDFTKVEHQIKTCPTLPDMLDYFRDFLRGAGFEFSEQIVFEEELEEGVCTIDEIAEENEFLKARVEQLETEKQAQYDHWIGEVNQRQDEINSLQNKLSRAAVTRVTVITREGREYETWLDDTSEFMLEYQDGGRTLKLFEIDRDDRELVY